jgi:hypothetical protein
MLIYLCPLLIIASIYVIIVKHAKQNSFSTAIAQSLVNRRRQRRELRRFRRLFMLVSSLFIIGFPYAVFFVIGQLNHSVPPYAQQVCLMFVALGHSVCMLLNLIHNDDARKCMMKTIQRERQNIEQETSV